MRLHQHHKPAPDLAILGAIALLAPDTGAIRCHGASALWLSLVCRCITGSDIRHEVWFMCILHAV